MNKAIGVDLKKGDLKIFFKDFIYLYLDRGERREREGEKHPCTRETSIDCLSHAHSQGPGPQPRHVPQPGIKPVTSWFAGQRSFHLATPARAS